MEGWKVSNIKPRGIIYFF